MATVDLHLDFKAFLKSLNSEKIKYLLIGGYAVIYYGHRRVTDDLDIWIDINPKNAEKVSLLLQKFAGFAASEVAPELFLKKKQIFMFGREPVRIDLLTSPDGITFASCYKRRKLVVMDRIKVPLISLTDLRVNKKASGRSKDRADLENLPSASPRRVRKSKLPKAR